jgi:hypothetical protein
MIWLGKPINENYAWEVSALYQYRDFSDGVSFFDFNCSWDRFEGDHTPTFNLKLSILNITLIEANIYYLHHSVTED